MAKQIQFRRGTEAQNNVFTGALGEITVDTTNKTIRVHDGATGGGTKLALDSAVVHKTGDETISGVKTFSNNLVFASGTKITGDFSNSTHLNKTLIQTSTLNNNTVIPILPNGTGTKTGIDMFSSIDTSNTRVLRLFTDNMESRIESTAFGVATVPITFYTGGTERVKIDTSGNVLVTGSGGLGYGTGSGGTVTQLTSKSTAVTLNKPTGVIIINNEALAAGASVLFPFYNSTHNVDYDQLIVNMNNVVSGYSGYRVENAGSIGGGGVYIRLTNISGISLSESPSIRFTVIKGATA